MRGKKSEKGQAILLITAGIITLLGFAALAIDGGRLYSERRKIQGVSDTTAMTGALYLAHYQGTVDQAAKDEAVVQALERAAENGYTSSEVTVTIADVTEGGHDFFVVTAHIDSSVQPTLAKLFYPGDFSVAAKSVARVENNTNPPPFALGQAFYAINKTACKAIDHQGNMDITVTNSGLFSNSSCCSSNTAAINIQGNATMNLTGDLTAAGCIDILKDDNVVTNNNVTGAPQYTLPTLTEPDCTGLPVREYTGQSTLEPGYYPNGMQFSGGDTWTMNPGFYCLDNDFEIHNGALIGQGIMIFQRNGSLHINGGLNDLRASQSGQVVDGAGVVWDGMLFFQAYGNTEEFILNGNAGSYYQGTIFVPDGHCRLNGSGLGTALDTQFVCDTIEFKGDMTMILDFNQTTKYVPPPPTTISLVE